MACFGFTTPKGGVACALGLQWWTKDTIQSVLILDSNIVYSLHKQSSYIASQWSEDCNKRVQKGLDMRRGPYNVHIKNIQSTIKESINYLHNENIKY